MEGTVDLFQRWLNLSYEQRVTMQSQTLATFKQRFTVEAMAISLMELMLKYGNRRKVAREDNELFDSCLLYTSRCV